MLPEGLTLPPPAVLVRDGVPETTQATSLLQAAQDTLAQSVAVLQPALSAEPTGTTSRADRNSAIWSGWRRDHLAPFLTTQLELAGPAIVALDAAIVEQERQIVVRETRVHEALGRLVGDGTAGAELGALLLRISPIPRSEQLQDARRNWQTLVYRSNRLLAEIGHAAPHTNSAGAGALADMLNNETIN